MIDPVLIKDINLFLNKRFYKKLATANWRAYNFYISVTVLHVYAIIKKMTYLH